MNTAAESTRYVPSRPGSRHVQAGFTADSRGVVFLCRSVGAAESRGRSRGTLGAQGP